MTKKIRSSGRGRLRLVLSGLLAMALLMVAGPALAYTPPSVSPFNDVPVSHSSYAEIAWMKERGISTGWNDGTYRPNQQVDRDAMAAFFYRYKGSPSFSTPGTSPFVDITTQTPYYKEMAWMKSTGISTGWSDNTYRPWTPTSRDAMAAFLYRVAGSPSYSPPGNSPYSDITPQTPFYKEMAWLGARGIATDVDDGTFDPWSPVTRETMAVMMFRLDGQTVEQPPPSNSCEVLRCIAITFDDGPLAYNDDLLWAFADRGAKATFFDVGSRVAGDPNAVARKHNQGMEIGIHGWDHIYYTNVGYNYAHYDFEAAGLAVERATGRWPNTFRPPYGYYNPSVASAAGSLGMATIMWTDNTYDYEQTNAQALRDDTVDMASRNSVILMHDGVAATASAIPGIIDDLQEQGYTLVTVSTLLGGDPDAGRVYFDDDPVYH